MSKFGLVSVFATLADLGSFTFLFRHMFPLFWAEICSAFIGMIINFFLQKRFVFDLNRKVSNAFMLSIGFSFAFMFLGAFCLAEIVKIPFFAEYVILAKLIVMGSKFILNYFTKRWIFENR